MSYLLEIAGAWLYKGHPPERDPQYRRFVRRFPCAGCGARRGIDACHTGPHGLSTKASDYDVIPLCHRKCHREYDKDPQGFVAKHKLEVPALIQYLRHVWEQKQATQDQVDVWNDYFAREAKRMVA